MRNLIEYFDNYVVVAKDDCWLIKMKLKTTKYNIELKTEYFIQLRMNVYRNKTKQNKNKQKTKTKTKNKHKKTRNKNKKQTNRKKQREQGLESIKLLKGKILYTKYSQLQRLKHVSLQRKKQTNSTLFLLSLTSHA